MDESLKVTYARDEHTSGVYFSRMMNAEKPQYVTVNLGSNSLAFLVSTGPI